MNNTLTEVQQIQEQIRVLQERAALLIMEGRDDAIAQIKAMMADYTITAADLGLVLKAPPRVRPQKYRDPASGKTWSGQGIAPKWIEGKEREQFLVDKGSTP